MLHIVAVIIVCGSAGGMWSFMETFCTFEGGISRIVVVVIVFAVVLVVCGLV